MLLVRVDLQRRVAVTDTRLLIRLVLHLEKGEFTAASQAIPHTLCIQQGPR